MKSLKLFLGGLVFMVSVIGCVQDMTLIESLQQEKANVEQLAQEVTRLESEARVHKDILETSDLWSQAGSRAHEAIKSIDELLKTERSLGREGKTYVIVFGTQVSAKDASGLFAEREGRYVQLAQDAKAQAAAADAAAFAAQRKASLTLPSGRMLEKNGRYDIQLNGRWLKAVFDRVDGGSAAFQVEGWGTGYNAFVHVSEPDIADYESKTHGRSNPPIESTFPATHEIKGKQ